RCSRPSTGTRPCTDSCHTDCSAAPAHQIVARSHTRCSAAAVLPAPAVDQNNSGLTATDQTSPSHPSPSLPHSAATETAPSSTSHLPPSCSTAAGPCATES